jgi:hypothetical protein
VKKKPYRGNIMYFFPMRSLEFIDLPNPSGFDLASNRNEYQEYSWGVKAGRRVRLTNLTAIYEPIV